MTTTSATVRLTQYAHGGGCACKIPPGELEDVVRGLRGGAAAACNTPPGEREAAVAGLRGAAAVSGAAELVVGLDDGDDAAVVRTSHGTLVATADFLPPVVDDPYDWGRIAAANALSDVYAMGGTPVVAVNLLAWPRDVLPFDLARDVLRGGLDIAAEAGCHVG